MRVGLVGAGFIGKVHSWAFWALKHASLSDARIVAVHDQDMERAIELARHHDAQVMELGALLDAVDVVWICTPTSGHLAICEAAAARGLAVFCEKPLAPDMAGAEAVANVLRGVPHQVGLVLRTAPVMIAMADHIASGRYGRPMSVTMRDDQFFPITGQYASAWRADKAVAGGGTLIEHSIHDVDLFRMLLGDPVDVSCRTSNFFGYEGIEDLAVATFGFPDGVVAHLTSVWHNVMTRPSTRRLEVFCEDGHLWTVDDNTGPLHIETSAGHEERLCPLPAWADDLPVPALGMYTEAARRFLAEPASAQPDVDVALAAHRWVDAAYRSAADGGAITS